MKYRKLRAKIRRMHRKEKLSYTEIGKIYGVSRQTIQKIAKYGYKPKDKLICIKLGLGRRTKRSWFDFPPEVVLWALENREEF